MPGVLLYSDGDSVTLTWTPSDVITTEIAAPNDYQVTVVVFMYMSERWIILEELDTIDNTGTAVISLEPGPHNSNPILPITFHIRAADSANLADYIRPVVQEGLVGIWSPIAYKLADPSYNAAEYCGRHHRSQHTSGEELLEKTIPCPCRAEQGRIGNSKLLEQHSAMAVQTRRFFYPDAATCFLSTVTG